MNNIDYIFLFKWLGKMDIFLVFVIFVISLGNVKQNFVEVVEKIFSKLLLKKFYGVGLGQYSFFGRSVNGSISLWEL